MPYVANIITFPSTALDGQLVGLRQWKYYM